MAHPVEPAMPHTFQAASMAKATHRIVTDGGDTSILTAGLAAVWFPSAQRAAGPPAPAGNDTVHVGAVLDYADDHVSISPQSASTAVSVADLLAGEASETVVELKRTFDRPWYKHDWRNGFNLPPAPTT